jgi:hypothetical protein
VSKRFVEILASYSSDSSIGTLLDPSDLKFLWACRTFVGDNDMDTIIRHFEIHWAKRVVTIDDEDKEAQYGCYTFQTRRVNKNQAPVELAPAYKNKWANHWHSYWFYATIPIDGMNAKHKEVITYDQASRMVDLDVELAPEVTKASRGSSSNSVFFQDTHVITTQDSLEEFVAVDIWPCKPQWGSWAFRMKKLPGLDFETHSAKFNVTRPEGRTDEEILAEVERKVIQMIGNYT